MVKFLNIIFFVFILAKFQQANANIVLNLALSNIKKATRLALQELILYYGFLDDPTYVVELAAKYAGFTSDPTRTYKEVHEINRKLDKLSENVLRFETDIIKKLDTSKEYSEMTKKLDHIYYHVGQVNRRYKQGYQNFMNESDDYDVKTLVDFAEVIVGSDDDGIINHLEELHRNLLERDTTAKNIPMYYAEDNDFVRSVVCQKKQSAQRLVFNTYELIIATEMKGIAMLMYSYGILKEFGYREKTALEIRDIKKYQKERIKRTFDVIKAIAATAPREIWPCDPKVHKLGVTYEKVGPILQKYVMWEGNAVKDPGAKIITSSFFGSIKDESARTAELCHSNCPSITYVEKSYCNERLCVMPHYNCKGHTRDCEKLHGTNKICSKNDPDDVNRRYTYIKTGNGKTYGNTDYSCNHETEAESKLGPQTVVYCDYCLCTCQDNSRNDIKKYIDFTPVFTEHNENRVITGARIVNVNNTFRIQIEDGVLLPKGRIDRDSVVWQNVTHFSFDEDDDDYLMDYFELNYRGRTFILEDSIADVGRVITGLRFMMDNREHMKIQAYSVPFDPETGKLGKFQSVNYNEGTASVPRKEFKPKKYETPTKYYHHMPDSTSGQYINLTTSDLEQDVGQNVVPYFDVQPVNSPYPMPLSGVGLIHTGYFNSAGFLALKLITYDINELTSDSDEN